MARPARSLPRAALLVAPATVLANLLGYAFILVMSRLLGPQDYGELGSALGLVLIGTVPALAMQPVVARLVAVHLAEGPEHVDRVTAAALSRAVRLGLGTAGVLVLLAPFVTAYLRLDSVAPALWLAASLAPAPVLLAAQGALQGRERFGRMSTVFVVAALARLLGAYLLLALGGGVAAALAGTALGALVAAGVAVVLVGVRPRPAHDVPAAAAGEIAAASAAMCGLLVLCNVDVLLARHYLPATEAGYYAVGTVLTRAALWAPQAATLLVFARLAQDAADRRLLHRSAALVAGLGAALVAGAVLLGGPAVRLLFGPAYAEIGHSAWIFTATGAALALAQLLLFARLAVRDRLLPVVVLLTAVGQIAVVVLLLHADVEQVALASLGAAVLLLVLGGALERWGPARVDAGAASAALAGEESVLVTGSAAS